MATTDDARARARRIVEETLLEAGLVIPPASSSDGPPLLEVAGARPSEPQPSPPGSGAAARARWIVAEVLATRAAEDAQQVADLERRAEDAEPAVELAPEPAVELAPEPARDQDPDVAVRPTAAVDLLPEEPPSPPATEVAVPEVIDGSAPELDEPPLPGGPPVGGPPPPPLATVDGWWQTVRERYRRRQAMAAWAPDATRPPRRTGRWLLVTLIALGAIVLLYPMAVDALRQLVAL